MARVIVILTLLVAITATMFAVTRKPAIAPGEAADGAATTVPLGEVPAAAKDEIAQGEEQSLTAAAPRPQPTELSPAAPASTQDVTNGPVAGAAPTLATAGIDHRGNASFTGTATPDDVVTLVLDGKPMGTATADASGNWEIAFKAKAGTTEREIVVSAKKKDDSVVIGPQRATLGPPATKGGLPQIAMKSVDRAAPEASKGLPEPKTGIVVEKVAGGEGGSTTLKGQAHPGATLTAIINGKPAGETHVGSDGNWSLTATNASRKGSESVTLQLVDKDGVTLDRTEVPHKVPAASAKLASKDTAKGKSEVPAMMTSAQKTDAKAKAGNEDLAALFTKAGGEPKVVRVRRGDSLWRIAKRHLGKGREWAAFYEANKAKIDDPNLIYPGQTLVIPG